jgi:hypothetical protein
LPLVSKLEWIIFDIVKTAAFFIFNFRTVTGVKSEIITIWGFGFRIFNKFSSTTRYMYLLKRDIFETAIPFLNFTFFIIILIALDGSIPKFFFLVDFMRATIMPDSIFPELRYILRFLSYFLSFELSGTCILFIFIRIMRRLAFISFLVWIASAANTLLLLEYALSLARDLAHSWPRGPHQYYLCATPPSALMVFFSAGNALIIIILSWFSCLKYRVVLSGF